MPVGGQTLEGVRARTQAAVCVVSTGSYDVTTVVYINIYPRERERASSVFLM